MNREPDHDRSDWFVVAWIVLVILVIASGGAALRTGTNHPPNHTGDYTGVCNRPTTQLSLGC